MPVPERSGALEGLRVLRASDIGRYKHAVASGRPMGWGYYFPYWLSRIRPQRSAVLLAEEEGSFCTFLWRRRDSRDKLDLLVAPTPMNASVLRRCIERANDFNGDRSARILRIDAKDVDAVSSVPELRVRERKTQYLYAPRAFSDTSGRRYRTLRRNVALIEGRADVEVVRYDGSHAEDCRGLLRRWARAHRDAHGTAGGAGASARAIELAGTLSETDLRGEVVFVGGRLSAFAFGGEIRPGVGCFFDAKCEPGIRGLSYFQRYSFMSRLREFEHVNDGSDVGRAGLRQLKESLRPVAVHLEYRGSQREASG